jgi:type IV pilus assembly protein PilA
MKKKARKKGFTLVEVLVVMAIIALLAATAIPKVKGIYQEAQLDKAEADAMQIAAAIQRVELKNELSNLPSIKVFSSDQELANTDFETLQVKLQNSYYTFKYVEKIENNSIKSREIQILDKSNPQNVTIERTVIIPE